MNKNAITQKQQNHLTKICKYCSGTGLDIFDKKTPCPNCVLPYQIVDKKILVSECCGAEMQPEDSRCPDCKDGAIGEEINEE